MNRRTVKGIVTGGIVGLTVVMYAVGKKFHGRKMMKNKRRALNRVAAVLKGFNVF